MAGADRGFPPGDFRVSDADRDRALSELGEAFWVGRITVGEFRPAIQAGPARRPAPSGSTRLGLIIFLHVIRADRR